jgi:hypothetical protein
VSHAAEYLGGRFWQSWAGHLELSCLSREYREAMLTLIYTFVDAGLLLSLQQ